MLALEETSLTSLGWFDVIQAEPHESSLLLLSQEGKTNVCSHGGYDPFKNLEVFRLNFSCLYLNI